LERPTYKKTENEATISHTFSRDHFRSRFARTEQTISTQRRYPMVRSLFRRTLLAVCLVFVLAAIPVHACTGNGCTGLDPAAQGCDSDGYWVIGKTLLVGGSSIGYTELVYSPTCQAVWARLNTYSQYTSFNRSYLSTGPLFFATVSTTSPTYLPAYTYSYSQTYDPSSLYHVDSLMYGKGETRIANGVKACGRIDSVISDTCTLLVDPDDL